MKQPDPGFRELYDQYFAWVWRSLRRLGVREVDVAESTQKVFLTAHVELSELQGRARPTTWLFAICQRIASDYRRSSALQRELGAGAGSFDAAAHATPAFGGSELERRVGLAEAVLDRLPEAQRAVFVLFELESMSADEIAVQLDLPIGTVRSRLRVSREAFRRELRRVSAANAAKEAV